MARLGFPAAATLMLLTTPVGSIVAQPRADVQSAPRFTLDAGATSVAWTAFPGSAVPSPRQSGVSVTPGMHFDGARHSIDLVGSWSSDPSGGGIVQGSGSMSLYTPAFGVVRGEFTGSGSGSRLADGFASARGQGGVRVHASGSGVGAWLGGHTGAAGYDSTWRRVQQAEVGTWLSFPAGALVLTATPTRVALGTAADRFTDIEAGARLLRDRAEFGVALGTRTGRSAAVTALGGATVWGTVAATVWVTPMLALTGSAGTYPVDAAMRFPGGRFVSAGMRVALHRAPAATVRVAGRSEDAAHGVAANEPSNAAAAHPALVIVSADGDVRTVQVVVGSDARTVEIAGSFNNWEPTPLGRSGAGEFRAIIRAPAGRHQVALRVNGGAWVAPKGMVSVRDEFGGESGIWILDR